MSETELRFDIKAADNQAALKKLGYAFTKDGELRHVKNAKKFEFVDQAHYEKLGDAVEHFVRELLKSEPYKMQPAKVPNDAENHCLIYHSENAFDTETLVMIIQGSGAVRPGQWARALCINDTLQSGTILPYLTRVMARGYGSIVLNPNENKTENGKRKISKSSSPEEHTLYVYDNYVKQASAKNIIIIAHSYGGLCTMELLKSRPEIHERLKAVAFTDSVHGAASASLGKVKESAKIRNWVKSDQPVNTPLGSDSIGISKVSAGHVKHEFTSHTSIDALWSFVDEALGKSS